jgi:hypothetical protein
MPGTADRIADEKPFCQRTAVVSALRSDREDALAPAREEDGLAPDVTEKHASIGDLRGRYSDREVGTGR